MASKVLVDGPGVVYWCPGCKTNHSIRHRPGGWTYDDNPENPTFSPSILVDYGNGKTCHHFVRAGQIQFLGDCYHELANKTVPMEDFDDGSLRVVR